MDFEATLLDASELEAWEAGYPGDPLTREAGIYVTLNTADPFALDEWMANCLGDRATRYSPDDDDFIRQLVASKRLVPVVYRVKDKNCVMQIRLAFPMPERRWPHV